MTQAYAGVPILVHKGDCLFVRIQQTYCFFGTSPTLTEVDIMYDSFTSAKWLIPLIADASLNCGLKDDVTANQLQFTAMAIYSRFRWLKASELMLFFFNFKAAIK